MAAAGDERPDEDPGEVEGEEIEEPRLDAEALARRRIALAQIRQYPDKVLRMRAREVESFDADLARLAERMGALMDDARGVGLAATQVGVLQRLFVFQAEGEERPRAVVNGRITDRSDELETMDEGCLSLQGVHVPVERALRVRLEGQSIEGEPFTLDLEEMDARVVQHELDHLDGVLMLERTDDASRRDALATLRRQL